MRSRKAIDAGDAEDLEEAVLWLEKHQDDPDIDTPVEILVQRDAMQLSLDVLRVTTVPAAHRLQCLQSLHQILGNILKDPDSERLRKIRLSNTTLRERILRFPQAVKLLKTIGFVQGNYWSAADRHDPCLEFRLPVDSDNPLDWSFDFLPCQPTFRKRCYKEGQAAPLCLFEVWRRI